MQRPVYVYWVKCGDLVESSLALTDFFFNFPDALFILSVIERYMFKMYNCGLSYFLCNSSKFLFNTFLDIVSKCIYILKCYSSVVLCNICHYEIISFFVSNNVSCLNVHLSDIHVTHLVFFSVCMIYSPLHSLVLEIMCFMNGIYILKNGPV